MGKKWRNKKKPQNGNSGKVDEGGRPIRGAGYEDIVKENKMFEEFYKKQGIVPEAEWDSFMETLREPLPASFRVTGTRSQSQALLAIVQEDFLKMVEKKDGAEAEEVRHVCLPWYPDRLAYQLNLTRMDIRKSEAYHKLHNFLISETESGNISRQETVSMIPPLVLDVQPHHKVLDMCAAPGSKTAQLIEALHREEGAMPAGMVVANDADNKRCYMLVHQAKRMQSPCFCITNHDAANMPTMRAADGSRLLFDRILCDVPCSGDGTMRKNADVWPKWNPANGSNLHGLQYNIAMRGLELLAEGGRLVYSTCSLNPIEDEAVVSRLLADTKGAVRLVDVAADLPGLKYSPGLTSWVNFSKDMVLYENGSDIAPQHRTLIRPHMFPSAEPNEELRKCLRILPHHQNTGGFFLAVLEKVRQTPREAEAAPAAAPADGSIEDSAPPSPTAAAGKGEGPPPKKKPRRMRGYKEDPYFFVKKGDPMLEELEGFYGLSSEFDCSMLMTRCEQGKKKNIYLCSPAVRDLIEANQERVKVINSGVKVFARCDNKQTPCGFRLAQEGSDAILPYLTKRKVQVTAEDLGKILQYDDVELPCEFTLLDERTQSAMAESGPGAIALLVDAAVPPGRLVKTHVVGWKGATSVRAYVQRNERIHYLRLLGADTSKYEKNKFAAARAQEEKAAAETAETASGDATETPDKAAEETANGDAVEMTKRDAAETTKGDAAEMAAGDADSRQTGEEQAPVT
ncbi:tRNA (cytosine(34)-C(5))-methyltransferase [Amphibalanus amphitrite]|uniref:tRNA (cytosine(34)-C(5))-methyltransferase n=1 Tax=Amphibalanus amphitrite TaxID=1232801 RepID=A0A6A4VTJ2_AMPAM|nr:tRNA (cytosine(34)-C(5))-methyltransferase [Amphibalanus amphitrite]